jgi:hypothetical protein
MRLQAVKDPVVDQNFREIESQFPIQSQNLVSPTIRGQVESAGGVDLGSGFTSERTAEGRYTIKLTTELTTVGVMVATVVGGTGWARIASGGKKEFKVETINPSTLGFLDQAFNFTIS